MAQIFHRSANSLARFSVLATVFILVAIGGALTELQRSSYVTRQNEAHVQTPPFSHQHHVAGLGIDCRYCHTSVEESNFAGIPPTKTCMNCHAQIWTNAPMLEPVRNSFRTGQSLKWERVHDLPEFVYFDHGIHINKGVGCYSCHGDVDNMPLMLQANTLLMEWCLDCHRAPEKFVRPKQIVAERSGTLEAYRQAVQKADEKARKQGKKPPEIELDETNVQREQAEFALFNARGQVFNMRYQQPSAFNPITVKFNRWKGHEGTEKTYTSQTELGKDLIKEYGIRSVADITSCNTCHR
jgi:hypothetical protein